MGWDGRIVRRAGVGAGALPAARPGAVRWWVPAPVSRNRAAGQCRHWASCRAMDDRQVVGVVVRARPPRYSIATGSWDGGGSGSTRRAGPRAWRVAFLSFVRHTRRARFHHALLAVHGASEVARRIERIRPLE